MDLCGTEWREGCAGGGTGRGRIFVALTHAKLLSRFPHPELSLQIDVSLSLQIDASYVAGTDPRRPT